MAATESNPAERGEAFPHVLSLSNSKAPEFLENSLKWREVMLGFESASREASLEAVSKDAIGKHTARQLLGNGPTPLALKSIY